MQKLSRPIPKGRVGSAPREPGRRADAATVGRPYLWGPGAFGQPRVGRVHSQQETPMPKGIK